MSEMLLVTDPTQALLFPGGCPCGDSSSRPMVDTRREYPTGHHVYLCRNCLRALEHAVGHAPLQDLVDVTRRLGEEQAEHQQTRSMLQAALTDLERSEHDFGLQRERADAAEANVRLLEEKLREVTRPPEAITREEFFEELAAAETTKGA